MKFNSFYILGFILVSSHLYAAIEGPPITDNNYRLDLRQGPVLGSAKQVALGGSYIGLAEGITALNSNPAGVAFRPERSKTKFDWDWTLGVNDVNSSDFDNNGESPPNYLGHKILSAGIMGQWGPWGLGMLNNGEVLKLNDLPNKDSEYVLNATNFALGRQFFDQELSLGIGCRTTIIKVRTQRFDTTLGKISGIGWNLGGVWNPRKSPWRFGVSFMSEITSHQQLENTSTNPVTANGLIVPSEATLPGQAGLGFSYKVKSAPFFKGHPWMVLGDLVYYDSTNNAVGVESVLAQKKQPIGTHRELSVRGGTELEAWPGRLRLRLGSYYEPSFYENVSGRTHITGGLEMRLIQTHFLGDYTWGLTYSIDSARDYLNQYLSIGFWYFNN